MTGDGSRETDDNQSPFRYADIAVMRSYTIVEITYFDSKLQGYNQAQIWRHKLYRRHGSTEYNTEHYSEIPNHAPTCPSYNAESDPESHPESHSYLTSCSRT